MVRLVEFSTHSNDKDMAYDVVDDLFVYMKNDPSFYRREYFPAMASLADEYKKSHKLNQRICQQLIDNGINSYCRKFNLPKKPEEIFNTDIRKEILQKICTVEGEEIRKGGY